MPLSKENRMQMAISVIQNKKIQSKRNAAAIFGISEATLRSRLKGIQPRSETRPNGHKLLVLEEEVLIKQLLDADK